MRYCRKEGWDIILNQCGKDEEEVDFTSEPIVKNMNIEHKNPEQTEKENENITYFNDNDLFYIIGSGILGLVLIGTITCFYKDEKEIRRNQNIETENTR